jgi:hypothetical protein
MGDRKLRTVTGDAIGCDAIPAAARRGHREDVLCASMACCWVVDAGGVAHPVCEMHERAHARAVLSEGRFTRDEIESLWRWAPSGAILPR